MEINESILKEAIAKHGKHCQVNKLQEECIELALAIQKWHYGKSNPVERFSNLIDEIADVKIMIEQACLIFPADVIQKRIDYKQKRLKEQLDNNILPH